MTKTFPPDGRKLFVPAQATMALDLAGLYGDQVDRDLGVWESPSGVWEPGTFVDRCERSRRVHGLTIATSWVDKNEVLHSEYVQPSRKV